MPTNYNIIITSHATLGLANILQYLEAEFSTKVVNQFLSEFDDILYLIKSNPNMFPKSSSSNEVRRALVSRLTSIYFTIKEDTILVLAIEDNRKQQPF